MVVSYVSHSYYKYTSLLILSYINKGFFLNEVCHIGTAICDGYKTAEYLYVCFLKIKSSIHYCILLIHYTQVPKCPKHSHTVPGGSYLTITCSCMWPCVAPHLKKPLMLHILFYKYTCVVNHIFHCTFTDYILLKCYVLLFVTLLLYCE